MSQTITTDGRSGFLRGRTTALGGSKTKFDPRISAQLTELDRLLQRPVFSAANAKDYLARPLTPRIADGVWADGSLAKALREAKEDPKEVTLAEHILATPPDLSLLGYAFDNYVDAMPSSAGPEAVQVLTRFTGIRRYVTALGFYVHGHKVVNHGIDAFVNFALNHPAGIPAVLAYAKVGAARDLIAAEHLDVEDADQDDSEITKALKKADLPLTGLFATATRDLIRRAISQSDELEILDDVGKTLGVIPDAIRPRILKLMESEWPIKVTKDNAPYLVPTLMSQAQRMTADASTGVDGGVDAFDVHYFEDDGQASQVSQSAVRCAAQLYYSMVLGDELNVFDVVNFFTHRYLVRGQIEIQDPQLRNDLRSYVFGGEFLDLSTNALVERTKPGERHMFYRQAFNFGRGEATDLIIVNRDFQRLWKVLMLEAARYVERAQLSPNPHTLVSKQNVMQAVEDLQYNLSTHCTGMATVISPLIHAELDFVIRRIFMHDEVRRHVVPSGGAWWRVVEALYAGLKNTRPKATVLYNKARLGHRIIRSIADYEAAQFAVDANFWAFINDVDAFITTQSILQEALTDDLKESATGDAGPLEPDDDDMAVPAAAGGANGSGAAAAAQDDWDF
jgi:hypothetical protein